MHHYKFNGLGWVGHFDIHFNKLCQINYNLCCQNCVAHTKAKFIPEQKKNGESVSSSCIMYAILFGQKCCILLLSQHWIYRCERHADWLFSTEPHSMQYTFLGFIVTFVSILGMWLYRHCHCSLLSLPGRKACFHPCPSVCVFVLLSVNS